MAKAKLKTTRWDVTEYLKDDAAIAAYLEAVIDESGNDPKVIAVALGDVARAMGMTRLARDAGISREALYRALSPDGNPEFATVVKVAQAAQRTMAEDAEDLAPLAEFRESDDGARIPHAVVKRMLADLTAQEDAAITAAARADPDAQPIESASDLGRVRKAGDYVWDGVDEDDRPATAAELANTLLRDAVTKGKV